METLSRTDKAAITRAMNIIAEKTLSAGEALTSSEHTKTYLRLKLNSEPAECFMVIFLDNQHRMLADEILFRGTIDGAAVYPREVMRSVFKHNAAAVIFAHNHPSGNAEPSQSDIAITRRLKTALETIDVRTLDHFVVGNPEVVSFAERGLL